MNKGICKAQGEYLNFMNSGDCFYDNDILEKVTSYQSQADFIVGKDYHFNPVSGLRHASIHPSRSTMVHFFKATLDHQSTFIRWELFNDSLYDESLRLVSDQIFFVEKIVRDGKQAQFIPNIICRREEGGLSEQQVERNRKEINEYPHHSLPQGVYEDYATLSKLDKTSLYRLFDICDNNKKRKWLVWCIKFITKII